MTESLPDKIIRIKESKRLLIEGAFWIYDNIVFHDGKATLKVKMEGDSFIRDFDLEKTEVEGYN